MDNKSVILSTSDLVQQRRRKMLEGVHQELRWKQAWGRGQTDLPQEGNEYELSASLDRRQYAREFQFIVNIHEPGRKLCVCGVSTDMCKSQIYPKSTSKIIKILPFFLKIDHKMVKVLYPGGEGTHLPDTPKIG